MTPCGCNNACGCQIVGEGGVEVSRVGDTFIISAATIVGSIPVIASQVQPALGPGVQYLWLQLDGSDQVISMFFENGAP